MLLIIITVLLWSAGDKWWPATVLLFGPRWLLAVPLPFLAVPAAVFWRRGLWLLLITAVVLLFPVLGFRLPWGKFIRADGDPSTLRVLTFNVHGKAVPPEAMSALLARTAPDIVALQESSDETDFNWPVGWYVRRAGELLVAARYPISHTEKHSRSRPPHLWLTVDALVCVVETPTNPVAVCNIQLHSPRKGLDEVLDRYTVVAPSRCGRLVADIEFRHYESANVTRWLEQFSQPLLVVGDFNMPVDSLIYQEDWSKYTNAFSAAGFGFGYTKWTTVRGIGYGMRIDHILADACWCVHQAWIGTDAGSDHLPLLADMIMQFP